MGLTILHTNDFHGTLTAEKADRIRRIKEESEGTLYFDTGDCIKTGNLGVPIRREKAWELLADAGCDASVIGNRESHVLAAAFNAKIDGHGHPVLCANLRAKDGSYPLVAKIMLLREGLRIGVLGVMVPMVTARMATQAASAFLWDPPIPVAERIALEIRPHADLVIALTHIGIRQDRALAEQCPAIDLILGGHSHTVLEHPEKVGRTWICHGGSHGRFLGVYEWDAGSLRGELVSL